MMQHYFSSVMLGQEPVFRAALGTVKFGRNQGVKYPQQFALPDDKALFELLYVAKALGINLLDTAPAYGESEARLGHLFRYFGLDRNEWLLVSKAGETFDAGVSAFDFSYTAITQSVERSLKRLNTDRLDALLLHSNGDDLAILQRDETQKALADLKQAGKILATGISSKTAAGGCYALNEADLDIAMITYHPHAAEERAVIETAKQQQKLILIKKALGSGHLATQIQQNLDFIMATDYANLAVVFGTINPQHLRQNVMALKAAIDGQSL